MKIINNNFLPYQVIEELNSKLADYLKLNVKLTFKIIDQNISSSELMAYISYYNKINNAKLTLIPIVENDKIYINLDDKKTLML